MNDWPFFFDFALQNQKKMANHSKYPLAAQAAKGLLRQPQRKFFRVHGTAILPASLPRQPFQKKAVFNIK
jgi:hypothetical protein